MKSHAGMFRKGERRDCQIQPGECRNPRGRAKVDLRMRELAREYGPKAIEVLFSIAVDEGAKAADRIYAADTLLNRGYGRPLQEISAEIGVTPRVVILPASLSAEEFEQRYGSSSLIELETDSGKQA